MTELLAQRGFRLTKWLTNHEGVLNQIPDSERSAKAKQYLLGTPTDDRVLGVQWQVNEDQFTFEVKVPTKPCTRRGILSTVASIYDPLGFVAPILLEAKRILQLLCKQTLGWDEPIGEVECNRWKDWLNTLIFLRKVKMPIVQTVTMVKQDCFNLLINRCSNLHKLKRLTARLLQFTSYLQHRV